LILDFRIIILEVIRGYYKQTYATLLTKLTVVRQILERTETQKI
jgi:hypothetical protein